MAQQEVKPIAKVACPSPELEALRGKTKVTRTMSSTIVARKGAEPETHEYIREDK